MTLKIWGTEDTIMPNGTGGERSAITRLPNGGYVMTYVEVGGPVKFQIYDGLGAKVGGSQMVSATSNSATYPDVQVLNAQGDFVVTWTDMHLEGTLTIETVYTQKFNGSGAQTGTRITVGSGVEVQHGATTSLSDDGGWATAYADGASIVFKKYTAAGALDGDPLIFDAQTPGSRHDVAYLGTGKFAISYVNGGDIGIATISEGASNFTTFGGIAVKTKLVGPIDQTGAVALIADTGSSIVAHIRSANGAPVASIDLAPGKANGLNDISATVLKKGGFAVAYIAADPTDPEGADQANVFVRVVDANGTVGPALRVNAKASIDGASANQKMVAVAEMADGRLSVSWSDSFGYGIVSQTIVDARTSAVTVLGTAGDDIYAPSESAGDTLDGGTGTDTLTFQAADSGVAVNLAAGVGTAGIAASDRYTGFEKIIGSNFADTLTGGTGANTLQGGAGDDVYFVNNVDTKVEENGASNGGTDTVYSSVSYTLSDFVEHMTATGANAIDLTGNAWNNRLTGNAAANVLVGAGGNDTLDGGDGNDNLDGGAGDDVLNGGVGADVMNGGAGNDAYYIDNAGDQIVDGAGIDTVYLGTSFNVSALPSIENFVGVGAARITLTGNAFANTLTGNDGANIIYGGKGNDRLSGGGGNDRIHGQDGKDVLYGGRGAASRDIFVFDKKAAKANVDKIMDFETKYDSIYLENKYFKVGSGSLTKPKQMASTMFYKGSAAHDADDRIVYNNKTGALYYDPDGNGGLGKVQIASLSTGLKMTYKDFFVI